MLADAAEEFDDGNPWFDDIKNYLEDKMDHSPSLLRQMIRRQSSGWRRGTPKEEEFYIDIHTTVSSWDVWMIMKPGRSSLRRLCRSRQCSDAGQEDHEAGQLLAHTLRKERRLQYLCSAVYQMPDPCSSILTSSSDVTLAILYVGLRFDWAPRKHSWEYQPACLRPHCYWILQKMGGSRILRTCQSFYPRAVH